MVEPQADGNMGSTESSPAHSAPAHSAPGHSAPAHSVEDLSPHSTENWTCVSRRIGAPRSEVYQALLDPRSVARWRVPLGMSAVVHEFDPRVGGSFRVSLAHADPTAAGKSVGRTDTYRGEFVALVADELVVETVRFESARPSMLGEMTVMTLLADTDGGTEIAVIHQGLPSGLAPDDNELGTTMALHRLARLLEQRSER